jgi:hypothetical protein
MSASKRTPRLIQMRLLADSETCDVSAFKRRLRGSGVEVDTTYTPKRVGPAVFVARGVATERAWRRLGFGAWAPSRRSPMLTIFEELRFQDHDRVVELDDLWGAGAQAMIQAQIRDAEREVAAGRRTTADRLIAAVDPARIETF